MAMTPQIDNQLDTTTEVVTIPSKTYKLNSTADNQIEGTRIAGFVDNLEAVRQAVYHIMSIERYTYDIYDNNYGVELAQYVGTDIDYISTTIEGTIREALTHDLRILDVTLLEVRQLTGDLVYVRFLVSSIYGDLQMEVNINV